MLATDYVEERKILSPEQEGFRNARSCSRAITHLGLCVEDAHTHKKDIVLCYLDFKGAFPSADHAQLVRTLRFLGLPEDFINIITNLYEGATTEFVTPHGHTPPIGIRRGTLQGDPLSPLLFDLMIEPLIRWLNASQKGYDITSCGLRLASKWYADDGTLVTNTVEDMIALLDIVEQFSDWSGIRLNVGKCKITAYIQALQTIRKKKDRDDALKARLAHVAIGDHRIGALSQDEPLPGGYLGTALTASLCPDAHLQWTKEQLGLISKAVSRAPLPPNILQRLLLYGAHSKINHTHCLMALSPASMAEVDSILEATTRKIWNLPSTFPRAGLHATPEEMGLNIPTIWEDYCGTAIRSWTQILNDEGALGVTARASLRQATVKFTHWPLELAFHSVRGHATCPSVIGRNVATLLTADLHPMGDTDIWSGNQISSSLTIRIPVTMDEDGCPTETQPFPPTIKILQRLVPLWENAIHTWAQILGRGPDGRPYFLDDREIQWANPTMRSPLPHTLRDALTYLRALLSSRDTDHWTKLKRGLATTPLWDLPIAPRWRLLMAEDWADIPDAPSPMALARATLQHSIRSHNERPPTPQGGEHPDPPPKITLHFPSPRRRRSEKRKQDLKRKALTTREPLRGSDANGENAGITLVLARCAPRHIKQDKLSTYVEEFLVRWDPEECTLQEAQTQQAQGFVITTITSLDADIPTPLLEAATATKRPKGRPRVSDRPSPDTKCRVQFAPSPQGPTHIRTIRGGHDALEAFLLAEKTQKGLPPDRTLEPCAPRPPPPAERPTHLKTQLGEPLLRPRSRPPRGAPSHPRPHGHHDVRTQTSSRSSRRKATLTETPPPKRVHMSRSSHRHPHGTHWARTWSGSTTPQGRPPPRH
jgi:hypothetical protein